MRLPSILLGTGAEEDIEVPVDLFASLDVGASTVFVIENEIDFLAFPKREQSMAVFGAGYGFAWARAPWLQRMAVHYWGDIDTHGFAILDGLRSTLPHARSLLMDRETLIAHRTAWVQERSPARRDLGRLTAEETALYDDLRCDRLGKRVRLEQERVRYSWLELALNGLEWVDP